MSDGKSPSGTAGSSTPDSIGDSSLLMELVREGKSFSGHERNCCFLNTGDGRFADMSFVSGVDFPDDGRGVAVTDWDQDGDLDLWISNRTSPQVRFLRNDLQNRGNFVALRLQGTDCNRDAIGARVEILLVADDAPKIVQCLSAGQGFLAQSSKWLHFGLGSIKQIRGVEVRWPGGETEVFGGADVGGRYLLKQGTGSARPWSSPARTVKLASSAGPVKPPTKKDLISVAPMVLPPLRYKNWDGSTAEVRAKTGRLTLVNLWASWCSPCVGELSEFSEQAKSLRAAGVDVLALSVDGLDPELPASNSNDAQKTLGKMRFKFDSGIATTVLVSKLQMVNDLLFDVHNPLPVPVSFLVDEKGMLLGIAKGPIEVSDVVDFTRRKAKARSGQEGIAGLPLEGRWASTPRPIPGGLEVLLTEQLISADLIDDAFEFVERAGKRMTGNPRYADLLHRLGVLLLSRGENDRAQVLLSLAADGQPDKSHTRSHLGWAQLRSNETELAEQNFIAALKIDANDSMAHAGLGQIAERNGDPESAIVHYERALAIDNRLADAYKSIAMIYQRGTQADKAIETLQRALDAGVNEPGFQHRIGFLFLQQGRPADAIDNYRAELKSHPEYLPAMLSLSWELSSNPDAEFRDGQEALQLANMAIEIGGDKSPNILRTLAAALAETGRFEEAISTAQLALEMFQQQNRERLIEALKKELQSYRTGKPNRTG